VSSAQAVPFRNSPAGFGLRSHRPTFAPGFALLRILGIASRTRGGFIVPLLTEPSNLSDRAEGLIRGNAYLALKNVSCDFRDGVLTLRGCLPSYYLKQVAQTTVVGLEGVDRIVNLIQVVGTGKGTRN
jgi:hypothetical protein